MAPQDSQNGLGGSQVLRTGPLAQLQCILKNEGEWIVRSYVNESGMERVKLERCHGSQDPNQRTSRGDGTRVQEIKKGVLHRPSRALQERTSRSGQTSDILCNEGSSIPNIQRNGEPDTAGWTTKRIRLRDNSTTWYDPNMIPDFRATTIVNPDITEFFKGTNTTGWDGLIPTETGKWYFDTCGGDAWKDSSEGIAAMDMGGQGIFDPDTDRPTAQDVYDYKKCYKKHGTGIADRSQNVTIVWRSDGWSAAHQRTEVEVLPGDSVAEEVSDQIIDLIASSNGDEVPISPRSVPQLNETARTAPLDEDDSSKLMPPPATPLEPMGKSSRRSRTSNAPAPSRRSTGQRFIREDTPHPGSTRKESAKRKSSEGSGSPPKALKLDSSTERSSRTAWPSKNSLGSTLKIFEKSSRTLGIGKTGGDPSTETVSNTVAEESEVATAAKEGNEEKKEQDRDSGKEPKVPEDSEG